MKKTLFILMVLASMVILAGCSRGEGGAAGYGAGGGQSLREGSTSPLHSPIAQDQTYQAVLGLNILLYPPPVDDPKFEPFGAAYWELDPAEFVQAMRDAFSGEMGDQAVYEPEVEALADHSLLDQISETIYGGEPVQAGWIYGNNASLDYLEYNGVIVTLVTAENAVLFVGSRASLDETTWTFDAGDADGFYVPANTVVALNADVLRSAPLRVTNATGQLTAVIVPEGIAAESASPGEGFDQALVANDYWVFGAAGLEGFYEGLTGSSVSINPVD